MSETRHIPILVQAILDGVLPAFEGKTPGWFIDCTLGGGGHTSRFLEVLSRPGFEKHQLLAVDQDAQAIERARERFAAELASGKLTLLNVRMSELEDALTRAPALAEVPGRIHGMMADLGFSSDQIDDPARGLSFRFDGPLDMRLDPTRGYSARQFLQQTSERELEEVLRELGEERFARRIAQAILQARRARELPETTLGLAELVVRAVPPPARHGRIHAATRTFQALRIRVNEELEELDALLAFSARALSPGGRIAILSFHSLEDRRVKRAFREEPFEALTKKPIEADEAEVAANPRARSAKLRVAEKAG